MVVAQGEVWWADLPAPVGSAPGNVLLVEALTGLPQDSVANVSQLVTLDRQLLTERVGRLPRAKLDFIFAGIDIVLGR